jgi:CubicO group peptidase (beta-lactamase class C family)
MSQLGLDTPRQFQPPVAQRDVEAEVAHCVGGVITAFWIDPREELTVSFFTQLLPSSAHRIRPQLRQLVYQALID